MRRQQLPDRRLADDRCGADTCPIFACSRRYRSADRGASRESSQPSLCAARSTSAFTAAIQRLISPRSRLDELRDDVLVERLDALCNLSTAELYLDRYIQSCEHGERCLRLARQSGRTQLVPLLTPVLGCSLFMCGRMDRSAEVLDESIEAARLANNRQGTAMALFDRALAALHQATSTARTRCSELPAVDECRGEQIGRDGAVRT